MGRTPFNLHPCPTLPSNMDMTRNMLLELVEKQNTRTLGCVQKARRHSSLGVLSGERELLPGRPPG